jgi:hypothetical protein
MMSAAQEPPHVILAAPTPCSERDAAEGLFTDALKPATAPSGWTVSVKVAHAGGELKAESDLADAAGAVKAHRDFTVKGQSCAPLARAVGVWASLVLDGIRADAGEEEEHAPPPEEKKPVTADTKVTPAVAPVWPASLPKEKPQPERETFLRHPEEERTLELGISTFLMNAGKTGPLVGGSLFVMVEAPGGIFLRPKASFGKNFGPLQESNDVDKDLGTLRLDGCLRVPGFYWDRRGLAIDICGGAEGGFLSMGSPPGGNGDRRTIAYGAFGPGISLRGEFANDFVAEVRAEGLMRIAEDLPVGGRAEMGITWRAR